MLVLSVASVGCRGIGADGAAGQTEASGTASPFRSETAPTTRVRLGEVDALVTASGSVVAPRLTELARVERLTEQGVAPPQHLDQQRTLLAVAKARVEQELAAAQSAEQDLSRTAVIGPYDAHIVEPRAPARRRQHRDHSDVAKIEDGLAEERSLARFNGQRGVSLEVRR